MKRKRLDDVLIEKGTAADTNAAFIFVTEGRVFVGGQKAVSPAQLVLSDAKIEIREEREFVGRGAYKLQSALQEFKINVRGKVCADIGSATGGFTEVLLKNGAKKVYAVDTAKGKLDIKLRENPRVKVMEGIDVRDLKDLSEKVNLVTIDVSLISLRQILTASRRFLLPEGVVIALFKPQYETRDQKILKHGVIRDSEARENLLNDFLKWVDKNNWSVLGKMESPIKGSKGNIEYLIHVVRL